MRLEKLKSYNTYQIPPDIECNCGECEWNEAIYGIKEFPCRHKVDMADPEYLERNIDYWKVALDIINLLDRGQIDMNGKVVCKSIVIQGLSFSRHARNDNTKIETECMRFKNHPLYPQAKKHIMVHVFLQSIKELSEYFSKLSFEKIAYEILHLVDFTKHVDDVSDEIYQLVRGGIEILSGNLNDNVIDADRLMYYISHQIPSQIEEVPTEMGDEEGLGGSDEQLERRIQKEHGNQIQGDENHEIEVEQRKIK